MKSACLYFLLLVLTCTGLFAQTFAPSDTIKLPTFKNIKGEFADLNNDGNLEFLLFGKQDSLENILPLIISYKNDVLEFDTLNLDTLRSVSHVLSDINNDNKLDILAIVGNDSIQYLSVFYQTGDFEFNDLAIIDTIYTDFFGTADLNNNGHKEIFYTYSDSLSNNLKILNDLNGTWEEDTILFKVPLGPPIVFDFDNNNYRDIFISGGDSLGLPYSMFFSNSNDSIRVMDSVFFALKDPVVSFGDINNDGKADLLGSGTGSDSLFHTVLFVAGADTLFLDSLGVSKEADQFMADFNSDGLADIILKGLDTTNNAVNYLLLNDGEGNFTIEQLDTLFSAGAIQEFADLDCDGDLDKIMITPGVDSIGTQAILFKNTTPTTNYPPGLPPKFAAFQIENEIKLFWEGSTDDHTPEESLTYDVYVGKTNTSPDILAPNFDMLTRKRLLVTPGNTGYNHEVNVTNIPVGHYDYGILPIDNSFNNLGCYTGLICAGSFVYCTEIGTETITACIGETVTLHAANENTGWYSIHKGFLGFSAAVSLYVSGSDTIYTDASGNIPCNDKRTYVIKPEKVKLNFEDVWGCADEPLQFELKEAHDSVRWYSANKGLVSSASLMEITEKKSDTIAVEVYKSSCLFMDTFLIKINRPVIQLTGAQFKIFAGESVALEASGVKHYEWSPAEGLDNYSIPNPIASPLKNSTYTVIGTDSMGCKAETHVLVVVENAAFIPTLFTPNEDAKNDKLLLYGIFEATGFSFQLYNRNGLLIYETHDIHEATVVGWDGTVNENPQAMGVYYWKVAGEFPDGKKILLNGKDSGAVHLIR